MMSDMDIANTNNLPHNASERKTSLKNYSADVYTLGRKKHVEVGRFANGEDAYCSLFIRALCKVRGDIECFALYQGDCDERLENATPVKLYRNTAKVILSMLEESDD